MPWRKVCSSKPFYEYRNPLDQAISNFHARLYGSPWQRLSPTSSYMGMWECHKNRPDARGYPRPLLVALVEYQIMI